LIKHTIALPAGVSDALKSLLTLSHLTWTVIKRVATPLCRVSQGLEVTVCAIELIAGNVTAAPFRQVQTDQPSVAGYCSLINHAHQLAAALHRSSFLGVNDQQCARRQNLQ